VREQLRIAAGEPLGYEQHDLEWTGHAIEARLYAEDVAAGFLPATGTLDAFAPAPEPAVRWDSGIEAGSIVGLDFDPMLAKVIAHAPTRSEAAGRLALALERLHIGGVTTNRHFLAATLRHPAFLAGDTTTDFIERTVPDPALALGDTALHHAAVTAALWLQGHNRATAPVLRLVPSGWRNARLPPQQVGFSAGDRVVEVSYRAQRDGSFCIGPDTLARMHRWSPDDIDVEIDGRRSTHRVTRVGDRLHLQVTGGTIDLDVVPRFPLPGALGAAGGLVAPMPGVAADVRVAVGDVVHAGQILVVLEAMKMEHHITAPVEGTITEVHVQPGGQVHNGDVLLVLEPLASAEPEAAS
jgi:propionyl-CoA carboxylase alpha chain